MASASMPRSRVHPALRALGWFWLALLALAGAGGGALQYLGAPPAMKPAAQAAPPSPPAVGPPALAVAAQHPASPARAEPAPAAPAAVYANANAAWPGPPIAAHPADAAIPPPDPALQEPSPDYPGALLPRTGPDRRAPMQVYAAAAVPVDKRPRIAILLTGIGMLASEDEEAVRSTPPAVSLAFSPYSYHPDPLLQQARARGHETLVSLPMEPAGYPLDDPGNRALLTGAAEGVNQQRLDWALTRFGGYVGVTSAMGNLRGERFAANATLMQPVLSELAARGLLYIDARPGAPHPASAVGRAADVVIDEPAVRTEIDAKLAQLEAVARDRGSAIGLAGPPRPVTVARIDAWAATLAARGFVLVPVSALASTAPAATASASASARAAP